MNLLRTGPQRQPALDRPGGRAGRARQRSRAAAARGRLPRLGRLTQLRPRPASDLGSSPSLAPAWGGTATSSADALHGRPSMPGPSWTPPAPTPARLTAEAAYGLPLSGATGVGPPTSGWVWPTEASTTASPSPLVRAATSPSASRAPATTAPTAPTRSTASPCKAPEAGDPRPSRRPRHRRWLDYLAVGCVHQLYAVWRIGESEVELAGWEGIGGGGGAALHVVSVAAFSLEYENGLADLLGLRAHLVGVEMD